MGEMNGADGDAELGRITQQNQELFQPLAADP